MYYLLKYDSFMEWSDPRNSLFLFNERRLVKTIKSYDNHADVTPTQLPKSIREGYRDHIVYKSVSLERTEYKALELMLTIGA